MSDPFLSRIDNMIDGLKTHHAKKYQIRKNYTSWSRDGTKTPLPDVIDGILALMTRAGVAFYGHVDILNTAFVLIAARFDYAVDLDDKESADECESSVIITIGIDYDSIVESTEAVKIDQYNEACYQNQQDKFIGDVLDRISSEVPA